jgi:hypothetical protein
MLAWSWCFESATANGCATTRVRPDSQHRDLFIVSGNVDERRIEARTRHRAGLEAG